VSENLYKKVEKLKFSLLLLVEKMNTFEDDKKLTKYKNKKNKLLRKLKKYKTKINEINNSPRKIKCVSFNKNHFENRHDEIFLILQYYDEEVIERRNEIIRAINKNVKNTHINKIIVFLDTTNLNRKLSDVKSDLRDSNKIVFVETKKRITYQDGISFSKNFQNNNAIFLLSNSDCYFTDTIDLLKKINYKNGKRIVCITRKDELEDGSIVTAKSPPISLNTNKFKYNKINANDRSTWNDIDYNSTDAWAFTSNILNFKCDYELGTWNCEYFFAEDALQKNIDYRNITEYVDCIHIHNSNYRREYIVCNDYTRTRKNKLYNLERNRNTRILGTWRLRSKYNFIDEDSEIQIYTQYVVNNFNKMCK
jgi:hypothetical protein